MIREIVIYPDPVLKMAAPPVELFDDHLKRTLNDLGDTMLWAKGAGLAAPQIGVLLRAIVVLVRHKKEDGPPVHEVLKLVNPRIVEARGSELMREGCLSLPGYVEHVKRATWVKVEARDENGQRFEVEGDGILAHSLQHEIDHLEGVVMVDRLSSLKRSMAYDQFRKKKVKGMRYRPPAPPSQDFTAVS